MKANLSYYLFFFAFFFCLTSSCSHKKSPFISKAYNIDKDFAPTSFILPYELPQQNPKYPWQKRTLFPSLTKHSFQCLGNYTEENIPLYQRCLGPLHHGLPLVDSKEYIYPRLIEFLNFLQKETQTQIIILRGHLCPKLFFRLEPQEQNKKYLKGAVVKISSSINWEDHVALLVRKFYKKKKEEDPLHKISDDTYPLIFKNEEFSFTIYAESSPNIMEIEVLYDKNNDIPVHFTEEDEQNYLRY